MPPPPCFWGEGNTRWRERGWESPNSDEGHTLWYSLYVRTLWSAQSMLYYQLSDHFRPHWGLHQHHGQSDKDKSESDAYEKLKEDPVDVQMNKSPMIQGLWAVKIPRDGQQTPDPAPPSRPCCPPSAIRDEGPSDRQGWRNDADLLPVHRSRVSWLSYRRQHRLGSH